MGVCLWYDGLFVLLFRYSQLNPLCFSLAYSGILVWRNTQRQQPSKHEVVSERDSSHSCLGEYLAAHKERSKKEGKANGMLWKIWRKTITWSVFHHLSQPFLPVHHVDDSVTGEGCEEGEDSTHPVEQQIEMHEHSAALLLESLNKAALHLRRAMVLYTHTRTWTLTNLFHSVFILLFSHLLYNMFCMCYWFYSNNMCTILYFLYLFFIISGVGPSWQPLDHSAVCVSDCVGPKLQNHCPSCSAWTSLPHHSRPAARHLHLATGAVYRPNHGHAEQIRGNWLSYTDIYTQVAFVFKELTRTFRPLKNVISWL